MSELKTHTIRVEQEQWEKCAEIAQATAEHGERPNVSAVVRKAIWIGLETIDRRLPDANRS